MRAFSLTVVVLAFSLFSFAKDAHKEHKEHREHGAHVHGSATVGIAFEEKTGKIDFKSPAEGIVGFEHEAKTAKDKKKKETALAKFEADIAKMIVFDASLKCAFTKEKIEVVAEEGDHSDFVATFNVACEKAPAGTKITFNFQKSFARLKDIDVSVLAGAVQKSVEAKKNGTQVELK